VVRRLILSFDTGMSPASSERACCSCLVNNYGFTIGSGLVAPCDLVHCGLFIPCGLVVPYGLVVPCGLYGRYGLIVSLLSSRSVGRC
jgi:hypothetical protein